MSSARFLKMWLKRCSTIVSKCRGEVLIVSPTHAPNKTVTQELYFRDFRPTKTAVPANAISLANLLVQPYILPTNGKNLGHMCDAVK